MSAGKSFGPCWPVSDQMFVLHPADLRIDGAGNCSLFACRHAWTPAAMAVTMGLASDSHRPAGLAWGPFCPQGLGCLCGRVLLTQPSPPPCSKKGSKLF